MNNKGNTGGFTIVELLIVIVVIGILAAITIVSFNGVTAKANSTSAKSAAATALKKAEAYNAEKSAYPTAPANLTDTTSAGTTYQLTGIAFSTVAGTGTGTSLAPPTAAPDKSSTILFFNCSTGQRVDYWDYTSAAADKWTSVFTGGATAALCPDNTYIKA